MLKLFYEFWGGSAQFTPDVRNLDSLPYPCFDLYTDLRYVCIQTSRGCPFRCSYCASHLLSREISRREPSRIVDEIAHWNALGIRNFAFYDDALLAAPEHFTRSLLQNIINKNFSGIFFHCPNALHAAKISQDTARLMVEAGFTTIRLGLETSSPERQRATGGKVDNTLFLQAVENLHKAGFAVQDIGVYLLCGLPRQHADEVAEAINFVQTCGANPLLAEYSPIPGTALWEEACQCSIYPLAEDPLYHNNSLIACRWEGFTYENYRELQRKIRLVRKQKCAGAISGLTTP